MPKDNEASLSGEKTFQGQSKPTPKASDLDTGSLGDQATYAGRKPVAAGQSLGDQATFGGEDAAEADFVDDGMEVFDLSTRYKIESTLGKGGMGEVLLATDTRLERKVAIKRILGEAARSRTAISRFLTEAKSIAALNHPNIVQIYDYGRAADGPFLIMEFVEGESLLDRTRSGALPLEEAVELTCQLCDGLAKAHDAGIIHRDIKPANVLLTKDGVPKLTDFGLAKAESADTGMTMAGAVLGTLDFMPPEQRRDAALTDARSDLWSLAASLYQLVTGKSPKIIKFNDVPKVLHDVLGKALEDSKDDRYQTARDFKQALKQALAAGTEVALETGDCPHCGTKNESNRKFCKKCAQSLEVSCLSCTSSIPMWEEVCGNCGTQQRGLVEQRKQEMAASRAEAEQLLEQLEFDKATRLATQLGAEPDLRLRQMRGWSEKFLQQVQSRQTEQHERVFGLVTEALKHQAAHDYPATIHTLEQVPGPLLNLVPGGRSETVAELLRKARGVLSECKRLEKLIKERIESRQLSGLLGEVEKLLEFRPDKADFIKLRAQLLDRNAKLRKSRDEAYAAAKKLEAEHEFEAALSKLAKIDPSVIEAPQIGLRTELQKKLDTISQLQQQISSAVAAKKSIGLLATVESLLALQPKDTAMQTLREQLVARDSRNEAAMQERLQTAEQMRSLADFAGAANLLSRIPAHMETVTSRNLMEECQEMADQRVVAMQALARANTTQDFKSALTAAAPYGKQLGLMGIKDSAFQDLYQQTKASLADQKQDEERRQRSARMFRIGSIAAAGLAVLAGGIFIFATISASRREAAINSAVARSAWDEVLKLDPENVPALNGHANLQFAKTPPDLEAGFADLARAPGSSVNANASPGSGSMPPATAAISGDSRRLRYHWKPGAEYMYQFTVEEGSGDEVRKTTGVCAYRVQGDSGRVETEEEGTGTGFVVSPDGIIATCAHVVEGAKRMEVHLNGQIYPATVIAVDPKADVALVRINATGLSALVLSDSDAVQLAESVRAIGYPLSDVLGTDVKVTTGTVAGIVQNRDRGKQIQIDAAINPGNSGGPVVNGAGQVVGVASAKLSGSSFTSVGFAAPVNQLRALASANGLQLPVAPRSQELAGPEVARRVTPGVAYIKVWGSSGGRMYEVSYHATFHQQPQMRSMRGRFPGPPSFGSSSIDDGKLTVNGLGEVLDFQGSEQLPAVLGPVGVFFLEPLDAYSESQWHVETESKLQRIKKDDGSFGGMGLRMGGRMRGMMPPGMGGQQDQVLEEIPATERVTYQVGQALNNRISIAKNYEYTATRANNQPCLTIRGSGTIVFDTVQGMPASLDYTANVEQTDDSGVVRVPVRVNYTLRDAEEVKREREQAAQKMELDKKERIIKGLEGIK